MGDASVTLDLDAREFDARLAAIEAKVSQGSKRMAGSFNGIGGGGLGAFASSTLGQFLTVGAGVAAVKSVVEYGTRVQDLSDRFGVSTDAIQHFGNAAEKNGSSLDAVAMGFNKLEIARSKALGGNGELAGAFLDLGITIADLKKMKPEDLMMKLGASSMQAAEMVKILGKNALELRPTLAGIADGTVKMSEAINSIDIKRLKAADDRLKTFGEKSRTVVGELVGEAMSIPAGIKHEAAHTAENIKKNFTIAGDAIKKLFTGRLKEAGAAVKELGAQVAKGGKELFLENTNNHPHDEAFAGVTAAAKTKHRDFSQEDDETFHQIREATKLTLGELAGRNVYDPEQNIYRGKFIGNDISKAQAAEREKGLAEESAFSGNEKEFQLHTQRFSEITGGIGSLKDSEKNIGVKEMVQSIEKSAQQIAKNTEKQFVNK